VVLACRTNLIEGAACAPSRAALEAPTVHDVTDPLARLPPVRRADKSDLKALAACLRGSRGAALRRGGAGDRRAGRGDRHKDDMVGSPHELAALIRGARARHPEPITCWRRDKVYKAGVLDSWPPP